MGGLSDKRLEPIRDCGASVSRSEREAQVSTNGGIEPRWGADVKELYFIAPDGKLMAASISASSANFETTTPVPLFPARVAGGVTKCSGPSTPYLATAVS